MSYVVTTHALARELLNKPDGLLAVTVEGKEYLVENIQRKCTNANLDDSMLYWSINTKEGR